MEYTIETQCMARQPYVAIRITVRIDGIGEVMGPLYGELFGWLAQHGLTPAGAPWARYLAVGPEECEMELAAPLAAEATGDGRITAGSLPACDVIKTLHVGRYEDMAGAYAAMTTWITSQNAQQSGAMWEVYMTDPMQKPDPSKYETWVYCPVSLPR